MRPIFLIAFQRAGTNLLRSALETSDRFLDCNEIFDPWWNQATDSRFHRTSFWKFRGEYLGGHPVNVPTQDYQSSLWAAYVAYLADLGAGDDRWWLMDIKVNSLHVLNTAWFDLCGMPFLLELLCQSRSRIVHLARRNRLEMYLSYLLANETGRWVVRKGDPVRLEEGRGRKIRVSVTDMLEFMERRTRESRLLSIWLEQARARRAEVLELDYEQLLGDGDVLSEAVLRKIFGFLGMDSTRLPVCDVMTRKVTPALSEAIENYESEVLPALVRAGYCD